MLELPELTTPFEKTTKAITPLPTTVYGLKFFPSIEPHNDEDTCLFGWPTGNEEVSDGNLQVTFNAVQELGDKCKVIMDIGIHRNGGRSMSTVMMDKRPRNSIYLGVDIEDKSYLDNPLEGVHTIKANSHEQHLIRRKLHSLGVEKIDLLFIDGWHSVNTCVNDWQYVDLLSDHGIVLMHDTNAHPGPIALFHAIDENMFIKDRYCVNAEDNGIAMVKYRKKS